MGGRTRHKAVYEGETPDLVVKKGNKTTRYVGELIPPYLVIARFFKEEEAEVDRLAAETETATQAKAEFEEEHGVNPRSPTVLGPALLGL